MGKQASCIPDAGDYGRGVRFTLTRFNSGSWVAGFGNADAPGRQPATVVHARVLRLPTRSGSAFGVLAGNSVTLRPDCNENLMDSLLVAGGRSSGSFSRKACPSTRSSRNGSEPPVTSAERDGLELKGESLVVAVRRPTAWSWASARQTANNAITRNVRKGFTLKTQLIRHGLSSDKTEWCATVSACRPVSG